MSQTIKEQLLKLFRGVCGKPVKPLENRLNPRKQSYSPRRSAENKKFSQERHWVLRDSPQNATSVLPTIVPERQNQSAITHSAKTVQPPHVSNRKTTCITGIAADARLNLSSARYLENYQLLSEEKHGIESRFDDNGTEIKVGLDFGTSTVKVVIKTDIDFIAVPFI